MAIKKSIENLYKMNILMKILLIISIGDVVISTIEAAATGYPQSRSSKSGDSCTKCPKKEKPVCGSNGKTYLNKCLLLCASARVPGLTVKTLGKCLKKPK